ncbi:unnamed protein product [Kuraishia capsulata CBS 1993]|uniref:Uncharacterized protein n=1 Tax=Kuraishia capsulata CBS 1993 TaxID=1382522 RepID=W6MFX3_9ASCO|nr:uncharacterized protein KUCA_T00000821001 [Kuraishia capsulata CBS 1993]CDK24854.1 unnamed protein product [Kuraishia capsulata CBS 1993]
MGAGLRSSSVRRRLSEKLIVSFYGLFSSAGASAGFVAFSARFFPMNSHSGSSYRQTLNTRFKCPNSIFRVIVKNIKVELSRKPEMDEIYLVSTEWLRAADLALAYVM